MALRQSTARATGCSFGAASGVASLATARNGDPRYAGPPPRCRSRDWRRLARSGAATLGLFSTWWSWRRTAGSGTAGAPTPSYRKIA